jgi:hypothetical protein
MKDRTASMTSAIRVKGIYNDKTIELDNALEIPPNTEVEVLVLEMSLTHKERLALQTQELVNAGVLTHIPKGRPQEFDFKPVTVTGKPASETIIEERR